MNPFLRPFLVSVFVIILAASAASAATPPANARAIETEITRLDTGRIEALLKGDLKALEQLFAEDMVYIHAAGRIDTKQPYLAGLATGNMTYVTLRYDPPARVLVAGPDTAIVTGRAHIETKNKAGQLTKRILTTTTVYARSAQGWKVVSYQGTPVQP